MIVRILAGVAVELVCVVVDGLARGALGALLPRRRRGNERPLAKRVVVGGGAMFDRAALYRAWAEAHGLVASQEWGTEYAETRRGRRTELTTGLVNTTLPKSPELLVRVSVEGVEATTLLERGGAETAESPALSAFTPLLDIEGVRDVAVTRRFVRVRFDPFVETDVLDIALAAFDAILDSVAPREDAVPYRG